ncbi:tetratricopeptide repeat protein [Streptomyces sp. NBC_01003]|uniref:tetratricopeptide repeat protein n=1 Tax=Streptomyces sp. NBC_01003 TaxID=2903714 RepID=UPI00386D0E35|nr:tetratricopeptide repeat protein [Streptomyces sp. NBC_01003]
MDAALEPELLIAVAGGGLTRADLLALTSLPLPFDASSCAIISQATSRWLGETIYVIVDAGQRQRLTEAAGERATADCVAALQAWADSYRAAGWPGHTPEYLLDGYFRFLASTGDVPRMTACATDSARHARLRMLTGGDVAAVHEVAACQAALAAHGAPDSTAAAVLEEIREALTTRNDELPTSLPATLAAAGDPIRADQLARSFCAPACRIAAFTGLAIALLDEGRHAQARNTIGEIAAGVRRLETSGYESVRDSVVRLAAARQWTSAVRIAGAAPTVVGRRECLRALVDSMVAAGHLDQAEFLALNFAQFASGQDGGGDDDTGGADLLALRTVIVALAADGQGVRAESLARAFPDRARLRQYEDVPPELITALAVAGRDDQFHRLVFAVPDAASRSWLVTDAVVAVAAAGDVNRAEELARSIADDRGRADALLELAVQLLAMGEPERALSVARSIDITSEPPYRRFFQPRPNPHDPSDRHLLLDVLGVGVRPGVVRALVETGQTDLAEKYVGHIRPESDRASAYCELAVARAEMGDTAWAESLQKGSASLFGAEGLSVLRAQGLTVLRAVIRAHLAAGDRDRAIRMANTARTPDLTRKLLCDIAVWMAENGMTTDAERFTASQRHGFEDTVADSGRGPAGPLGMRGGAFPVLAEMQAAVAAAAAAEGDAATARRLAQRAAELPWRSALALRERPARHGPRTLPSIKARHDLAHRRGKAVNAVGAGDAFEQLVNARTRVLGPDHPDTLTALHDLAHWRGRAGNAVGAGDAFEQLVNARTRALGPDHPDTLTALHDLAHWRMKAGHGGRATDAHRQLINALTRVLGPDHPDTLTALHDLAHWLRKVGDEAGAADAFAKLAHWRGKAGNAVGAGDAFEQLVNARTRALGPDHPDTLTALHDLAHWRMKAGYAGRATDAHKQLINALTRVLGQDHPDTLTALHDLAHWLRKVGDEAGAAKLLNDRTRAREAEARQRAKRQAERNRPLSSLPSIEEKGARADRPDTPTAHGNLTHGQGQARDRDLTLAALAERFERFEREAEVRRQAERDRLLSSLPSIEEERARTDRPDTPTAHGNLTHGQGQAGDAARAVDALKQLLNDRTRVLGPDHPDTLTARSQLAREGGMINVDEFGSNCSLVRRLRDLPTVPLIGPKVVHTDFLGRPLGKPPANTVTPACRLCSYLGPSFPVGTPLPDVLAPIVVHVGEMHPDSEEADAHPKTLHSYMPGLTDEVLLRVNTRRAENPYGDGTRCEPGCGCGQ